MMPAPGRVGAIVLAGGRSSRFGRDKLAERIDGRPILELAIDAVSRVATDVVVVSAPRTTPTVPAAVRVVHDPQSFEGPLAGLVAGLGALGPETDRAVVVAGDMPALVPAVLLRLLERTAEADIAVLDTDDGPRPLPIAIRPSSVAPAAARLLAAGERRLRALLSEVSVVAVDQPTWRTDDPTGRTLRDVDVPEDLVD